VILQATYSWYWAADVLRECGARVHLAHPLGVKGFTYRRVKNDERDAAAQVQSAKKICLSCPVHACLQFALETNQGMGIWGGMDEDERRRLRRRRRSGRRAPMTLVTS